jgi:hypothetical protein
MLLRQLHAAERAPRGIAGVLGAHALRDEPVFKELQMGLDLAREIGLRTTGAEE